MRHDSGLAASPPVRDTLEVGGKGFLVPFIVRNGRTGSWSNSPRYPRTSLQKGPHESHAVIKRDGTAV